MTAYFQQRVHFGGILPCPVRQIVPCADFLCLTAGLIHSPQRLAAVIIGEVVFSKIFHNFALKLFAVVIGAILYYIVIQVVLWLGLNTNDLKMLQSLVVAMFLAVPFWKNKYFRKEKKGGANHG